MLPDDLRTTLVQDRHARLRAEATRRRLLRGSATGRRRTVDVRSALPAEVRGPAVTSVATGAPAR